jgi:hypothetical protein
MIMDAPPVRRILQSLELPNLGANGFLRALDGTGCHCRPSVRTRLKVGCAHAPAGGKEFPREPLAEPRQRAKEIEDLINAVFFHSCRGLPLYYSVAAPMASPWATFCQPSGP